MGKGLFQEEIALVESCETLVMKGRVEHVVGLTAELANFPAPVGAVCRVEGGKAAGIEGEVVGFKADKAVVMPYGSTQGLKAGDWVRCLGPRQNVAVSMDLLGRVLDGRGRPRDSRGGILGGKRACIYQTPPDPLKRRRITEPIGTGVRSMDGLLTIGRGQRIGIFSGSGVGKSILMGMMARFTEADANVIALVGERGREVREFIEKDLGEEGLKKSVVVVATGNEPALLRVKAALTATTIAEYFRDQGLDVMLMMDSVTRMAMALREIGLSAGEPPATRGYPPSVFATLPRVLERSGCGEEGSITGIYTVLVEADDMNEPVGDTCRGILDGHIWLSRELAVQHHYPAISPLESISRLANDVTDDEHRQAAAEIKSILATYRRSEELINIGAYVRGSNTQIDLSIEMMPAIRDYLRQGMGESSSFQEARDSIVQLADKARARRGATHADRQEAAAEKTPPENE
ncbi:MAG: FliI/YscN family ATPase [Planctomycetes bacterium]|nr:FliI/YscN family ATPase [Planctomycetota bacterium]